MATINITENITLTASEDTIKEYTECVNRIDMLQRGMESAFEERDWEDFQDYDMEIYECYVRIENLNCA